MRNARAISVFSVLSLLLLAGCQGASPTGEIKPRLFDGMGSHSRAITTKSAAAQKYFDQGLTWAFAFNHDEAIRSFREAARLDPNCAMAWWGVSLCYGPHINNPFMPDEKSKAGFEAAQQALALRSGATMKEQMLIDAVATRYAWPAPPDRRPLDETYAAAMRNVWKANPDDADIATLYAESLMDLQPWDLWEKDGRAKGRTPEIVAALESAIQLDPQHPGALHLYIHAMEASPTPERAVAAADRLRTLVPAAGHLVHMPAHIDVRIGRWALASNANVAAIEADRKYRKLVPRQGFYHVYMAHNDHFLAWASMMECRKETALQAARHMIAGVPEEYLRESPAFVDPVMSIVYDVQKRFGLWDELLREPGPREGLPITQAMWRFNRGLAYSAKGQVDDALREREAFMAAAARVPNDAMMAINPAHNVLTIAQLMLDGEIAYRRGRIDEAVLALRNAVKLEDELRYMEPPEWIQPVRHTLGAILVDAGRYEDAEAVYREDLKHWPENGWALLGLARCLDARGAKTEAAEVWQRSKAAWARADTKVGMSCLCVKAKE